jgi:hypothetical protein
MSVQQVTWLFFRKPDELKEEELENLQLIRQPAQELKRPTTWWNSSSRWFVSAQENTLTGGWEP